MAATGTGPAIAGSLMALLDQAVLPAPSAGDRSEGQAVTTYHHRGTGRLTGSAALATPDMLLPAGGAEERRACDDRRGDGDKPRVLER
jgi:hypothetical protein